MKGKLERKKNNSAAILRSSARMEILPLQARPISWRLNAAGQNLGQWRGSAARNDEHREGWGEPMTNT